MPTREGVKTWGIRGRFHYSDIRSGSSRVSGSSPGGKEEKGHSGERMLGAKAQRPKRDHMLRQGQGKLTLSMFHHKI